MQHRMPTNTTTLLPVTILFLFFLLQGSAFGQPGQVPTLTPAIGPVPDLSAKAEKEFRQAEQVLEKMRGGVAIEALAPQERALLDKYGEALEDQSFWGTMTQGCSWYCGGGPYEVIASSALVPSGEITYEGINAHDFSFKTAWVEGVKGYGEGEFLEYRFKNQSPRVTAILIYNGYMKSQAAWKKNSRVRHLLLSVNGTPYARLALKDSQALQTFTLPAPLGRTADGKDLVLRFEIASVYRGTAYDDTALTELYFDGVDVHCLARGTIVQLEHGTKPIESIVVGDKVRQYDPATRRMTTAAVTAVVQAVHSHLITLRFDNGAHIVTTAPHPFWVDGKGWSSFAPSPRGIEKLGQYAPGDLFLTQDATGGVKAVRLLEALEAEQETTTFTLELDKGQSFIGNGIVVGTEHLEERKPGAALLGSRLEM